MDDYFNITNVSSQDLNGAVCYKCAMCNAKDARNKINCDGFCKGKPKSLSTYTVTLVVQLAPPASVM